MARRTPEHYLKAIEAVVRNHGDAMSVSEIAAAVPEDMPRRTLQARIAAMVSNSRLVAEGTGRATRYRVPRDVDAGAVIIAGRPQVHAQVRVDPVLSDTGAAIREHVTQPTTQRKPVGYQQAFLDGYHPDRPYLSPEDRELLHRLGRTSMPRQPAGTHARQVRARLLVDLSWNSSRLEGNTYSLLDTQRLLDLGGEATGKTRDDARMILNHRAAIEFLLDENAEVEFNRHTICSLHALLSRDLLPDPGAPGRLRMNIVGIEGSSFEPLAVPQRIEECFDRILARLREIDDPFEQAFFAMVQLPYLQPFEHVNKRLSRVAANIPLIRANLAPLSFSQVPRSLYIEGVLGVYELNRVELLRDVFLHAYRRSAVRYVAVSESMDPDGGLRLQHRQALSDIVRAVVKGRMGRIAAARHIAEYARLRVDHHEQPWFLESAQWELLGLHEHNCVLHGLMPADVDAWKTVWDA